jgi:hypothetical protein
MRIFKCGKAKVNPASGASRGRPFVRATGNNQEIMNRDAQDSQDEMGKRSEMQEHGGPLEKDTEHHGAKTAITSTMMPCRMTATLDCVQLAAALPRNCSTTAASPQSPGQAPKKHEQGCTGFTG